ncbi:YrrC family ATP-dependent DNA helicase [Methylorubrum extorquens]
MNARPPTHANPPKETLTDTVERVTFHNADGGFHVLKVQTRDKRDLVPASGHASAIGAGEWVDANGLYFTERQHDLQVKAEIPKGTTPTGAKDIERHLASGQMRKIGQANWSS